MGSLSTIAGTRIYLDTNVFIYAAEQLPSMPQAVKDALLAADQGALHIVTSELTLAEVLVKPLRERNQSIVDAYVRRLTDGLTLSVVAISRCILLDAAGLRAEHPTLKLPDAIHAATALSSGCTTFLTNDQRFLAVSDLPVLLISMLS